MPNLTITGTGTNRAVTFYNAAGSTHLLYDVAGYFAPARPVVD